MEHFAARLIKPLVQFVWWERSEQNEPAARQTPPVLSSAMNASGHRSARVLSLVLALEALRTAPEVFEPRR
jgi:hypothetical protein